jgi:hypothetical protein
MIALFDLPYLLGMPSKFGFAIHKNKINQM